MINDDSLAIFMETVFSMSLPEKPSLEVNTFIARSLERHVSTIPEVREAFQELRMVFCKETTTQFPQIFEQISSLETDAIRRISEQSQSLKRKLPAVAAPQQKRFDLTIADAVGEESDLDVLRQQFDAHQSAFIDSLSALHIRCRRIRGDGHCAFRAVATWALSTLTPAALQECMAKAAAAMLKDTLISKLLPVRDIVDHAHDALRDSLASGRMTKAESDALVHMLRALSASKVVETVGKGELVFDGESKEAYVNRMAAMSGDPEGHGGELEVSMLMDIFAAQHHIINFAAVTDPTGFATKHLMNFIHGDGTPSLLDAAGEELRKIRLCQWARDVQKLKELPLPEAKEGGQRLLVQFEEFNRAQRAQRIENNGKALCDLKPNALVLAFSGNGHYDLLIRPAPVAEGQKPDVKKARKTN